MGELRLFPAGADVSATTSELLDDGIGDGLPVVPPTAPTVTPPPAPPVVPAPATIAVKKAAVSGTAKVGQVLKAKPGKVSVPGVKVTYTWYAGSKAIKKATKASLKLTSKLKGKKVSVRITYTKAGYTTLVKTIKVGKVK